MIYLRSLQLVMEPMVCYKQKKTIMSKCYESKSYWNSASKSESSGSRSKKSFHFPYQLAKAKNPLHSFSLGVIQTSNQGREMALINTQSWIEFFLNLALVQFLQKYQVFSVHKCLESFRTSTIMQENLNFLAFVPFPVRKPSHFLRLSKTQSSHIKRPKCNMLVKAPVSPK